MYPEELYKLIVQEKVDFAEFVPVVLRELMEYLEAGQKRLEQLRILVCGSDSWYTREYEHFSRFLGAHTRLINSYGVSEATIDSTYFERGNGDLHPDQLVPIGRPYANMQTYILDKNLQPTPIGVPGELYIGGAGLAKGYLNRPELTAEKFIPNPLSGKSDERLYKTGDLARFFPDGTIELLGRTDFQVKIRGIRVEIGEIEAVLGQHPAVFQAAVKAVEDGTQNKSLAAYVALNQSSAASAGDLREFLKEKLPDYMVPTAIVLMDELPLMPNGKVNRNALTKPEMHDEIDQQYVAPRSETEEKITAIWQEVLDRQMIGVKHDFFELGGHSLIAARVMSRLNQLFGIQLPLRKLFEVTTIEKCAELIDALTWTGDQNVGARPAEEREIFEI
jgi:acyl-coenzyme A synthetase/AMP-(fatty) acid ligase/acyl carrier protein